MSERLSFESLRGYEDSGVDLPDMSYVFNTPNSVNTPEVPEVVNQEQTIAEVERAIMSAMLEFRAGLAALQQQPSNVNAEANELPENGEFNATVENPGQAHVSAEENELPEDGEFSAIVENPGQALQDGFLAELQNVTAENDQDQAGENEAAVAEQNYVEENTQSLGKGLR